MQGLRTVEIDDRVLVLEFDRILVGGGGSRTVQYAVALTLTESHVGFQFTVFLAVQSRVALLIDIRRGVILTDGEFLIRPFHPFLDTATTEEK